MTDETDALETNDELDVNTGEITKTFTAVSKEAAEAEAVRARRDAAKYRVRAKEAEASVVKFKEELEAKFNAKIEELSKTLETKFVAQTQQEREKAVKLGATALLKGKNVHDAGDALKSMDFSKVEYSPDGEPTNLDALVNEFATQKPYFFKQTSTSTPYNIPASTGASVKGKATPDDLKAAIAEANRIAKAEAINKL